MVASAPRRIWLRGMRIVRGLHGTAARAFQRDDGRSPPPSIRLQLLHWSSRASGGRSRAVPDFPGIGSELTGIGVVERSHSPPVVLCSDPGWHGSAAGFLATGLEL